MKSNRPVRVILKGQAKASFEKLNCIVGEQKANGLTNSEEMQILKSIKQKSELLKINPTYGDSIPKKLIPKNLNVSNLFRISLTGYWRMIFLFFNRVPVDDIAPCYLVMDRLFLRVYYYQQI